MLTKARAVTADEVVIDLEDAVEPEAKNDRTRRRVAEALVGHEWRTPTVAVRVNGVGTDWFRDDIVQIVRRAGHRLDAVVVPKVETAETIVSVGALLAELEHELGLGTISIEAQIETAAGLAEVEHIAASSPRLAALIFGAGDYAASLGLPYAQIGAIDPSYPGDQWHYPRSRIAVAAHAHGLDPIDSPFAAFRNEEGLLEAARLARLVGFVGKWVIHPDQIEPCNRAFSASAEELAAARRVLDALDEAARAGRGAAQLDGAMIDEASRRFAEAVISRAGRPPS